MEERESEMKGKGRDNEMWDWGALNREKESKGKSFELKGGALGESFEADVVQS
ncbi:hypothetical protein CCACVL1_23063 [Corchorus capsularis]|uniref:Uncharacterized protein n=1 Tax=Corchorus capsularis TaxID=210143 RepID=A0A1R3GVC3_COCAP|nr:hypothetical protein CCACVL1_23063 [Corchorus capsularis]